MFLVRSPLDFLQERRSKINFKNSDQLFEIILFILFVRCNNTASYYYYNSTKDVHFQLNSITVMVLNIKYIGR